MQIDSDAARILAGMIQELGYKALYNEENGFIESKMAGYSIGVFYTVNRSVQFYCCVKLSPGSGFGLEEANQANRKYRFAKFYIDDDGDVAMEADFRLDVAHDDASTQLKEIVDMWEGSLSLMQNVLVAARRAPAGDVSDDAEMLPSGP